MSGPGHQSHLFFGGRAPGILFQDFIYNRTDGSPQDIFKKLGDTATSYLKTHEMGTPRASNVSEELPKDHILFIEDLTLDKIKLLTSQSILKKPKPFEVKTSTVLSTQIYPDDNCIVGFYKAVNTYEQQITWCQYNNVSQPFSLTSINVYCECKFYDKETKLSGKCCRHITGQLRRAVLLFSLVSSCNLITLPKIH